MSILEEREGDAAVITIDRPHAANAVDEAAVRAIDEALGRAETDADVRAVVLTATGTRAFCAGRDLGDLPGPGRRLATVTDRFADSPLPVIGAAPGAAVGYGLELLLACDLVVAAEGARLGLPEARRGLVAADGGTDLPRRVPLAVALELGLTGEPIGAERARELGLVNRVVPAGQVRAVALELAAAVAASSPLAVAETKRLMRASVRDDERAVASMRAAAVERVLASEDLAEGAAAFAEKREPRWRGR